MDTNAIRLECLKLAATMVRFGSAVSLTKAADELYDWITAPAVEAEAAKANAKKVAAK